jgi:DNA-binding cell septation regulator SpoVG
MKDRSYRDIAHPLNQDTRQYFEKKILEAYEKAAAEGGGHQNQEPEHGNE